MDLKFLHWRNYFQCLGTVIKLNTWELMAKGPAHGKCQMHFWTDSKILWQLCLDTTAIWVPLGTGDDPGNCFLWICGWRYNNTSRGCGPFMMEALCWFFRRKKKLLCLTLWVLGEVEVSLSLSLELSGTQLYCHVRLEVKKKKKVHMHNQQMSNSLEMRKL